MATSHARHATGLRSPRPRPKWVALAVAGWLALSLVLFLISAQTQDGVSAETERALSSKGNLFTGSNILVLGSDVRTGESIDKSQSGPGRSDTIMLVHPPSGASGSCRSPATWRWTSRVTASTR